MATPPDIQNFKLDSRVIVFLTKDRHLWYFKEERRSGKKLTLDWKKVAAQIGWYDYIYGSYYLIPRIYHQLFSSYHRFGAKSGVVAHFAESSWYLAGEAPKIYLAYKLMWNPKLNANLILDEWYDRAVGTEAAKYLKEYFLLWEDFWTPKSGQPLWENAFGRKKATYLPFYKSSYMNFVLPEMFDRAKNLMNSMRETVAISGTEDQNKRASILYQGFEYYESVAYAYFASEQYLKTMNLSDKTDALIAAKIVENGYERNLYRIQIAEKNRNDPVLALTPNLFKEDSHGSYHFKYYFGQDFR